MDIYHVFNSPNYANVSIISNTKLLIVEFSDRIVIPSWSVSVLALPLADTSMLYCKSNRRNTITNSLVKHILGRHIIFRILPKLVDA